MEWSVGGVHLASKLIAVIVTELVVILSSVTSSKIMLEASRKASVASSGCRNEDCACRHLKSFHLAASYAVRRKVDNRFKVTLDISPGPLHSL